MIRPTRELDMQKYYLIFTALLLAAFSYSSPALAETCKAHELDGNWINVRAEKKILHRIEIESSCAQNAEALTIKIRALEKSHPRDCTWGWSAVSYTHLTLPT